MSDHSLMISVVEQKGEPMSDLISRADAISVLDNFTQTDTLGHTPRQIVEALPSAQSEPQWISVSEGLPKKDGRYQVTRHDDVTNTEFIDILWYEKNTWWNRQATGDYAVTAWMPLPEPYREEGDE